MNDYMEKDLLRFLTCGSVDDGKSTLIGRLLFDSKKICRDQLIALKKDTRRHGTVSDDFDYALLLDGLQAEREQKITIDVAYRYFETPVRKFIIADTPGHVQYTRNMVTGASTADMAVVLVDASKGLLTQTKRHAFIVSLLKIPHLILVVNKMDLVGYSQEVYNKIVADFKVFMEKLEISDIIFIPTSALKGDNVVNKSNCMQWYNGDPLLKHLEEVYINADKNLIDLRFPVQNVIRPHQQFRGYAGRIVSGIVRPGEEVMALPSGQRSKIKNIITYDGELDYAFAGQSVVLTLKDEIDISRGNMIVRINNLPDKADYIDAMICWMSDKRVDLGTQYIIKHNTLTAKANINRINYRVDVNTLHREEVKTLELNDIGRIELQSTSSLFFDPYKENRATGSFILIDPMSNTTVASGMIRGKVREAADIIERRPSEIKSRNISIVSTGIDLEQREKKNKHQSCVIWLTGLSGSGKSTIAGKLVSTLFEAEKQVTMLDGDNVRHGLCSDLGFSDKDRDENIRRIAEVAKLFYENGNIVICSFISPYKKERDFARSILPPGRFVEVYVKCDLDICKRRDPRGLYKKALAGEIKRFTGIDAPYEVPDSPEITAETDIQSPDEIVHNIISRLKSEGII